MKATTWINAVRGEKWCLLLTLAMRLVVGGVFVFSGFVKAVDPWGTCYKLTDYMNALGMGEWTGLAMLGAVVLATIELLTGVCIVMGAYRRGAPLVALLMLLVMTPLTLWLALTNAVADCGCFGDAVHLSNWATFGKNVLLLLGVVWLLLFNRGLRGVYGPAVQWVLAALTIAFSLAVAWYGYNRQPLIDFRPYPVGTQLATLPQDEEKADEDADEEFIFVYSKDGEEHEFSIDSLPDEEDGWEYVTRYHKRRPRGKVIVQDGSQHNAITVLDDDGEDVTAMVLEGRKQLLLLFPDLQETSLACSFRLNELEEMARMEGAEVIGLTPADATQVAEWQDVSLAQYPIYRMDDSELKMVARGNPAVVYVEDGAIQWKRTLSSLDWPEGGGITLAELNTGLDDDSVMTGLMLAYLAALLALVVFNRSHLLIRRLYRRLRKH